MVILNRIKMLFPVGLKIFLLRSHIRCRGTLEKFSLKFVRPNKIKRFLIVSCERNVGRAALNCLDSVYRQNYNKRNIHHVFIDDASNDGTHDLIQQWLNEHPDHSVEYIHNEKRVGGTVNNITGFKKARAGDIVLELNGDDWLPDNRLLDFLNRIYENQDIWMTNNTAKYSDGQIRQFDKPFQRSVIESGTFRQSKQFPSHLHSFRSELLCHIRKESLIDPETGQYWASADDLALYLPMLELCGKHARHLYRITYVYNYHENAENKIDEHGQVERSLRIRKLPGYQPLASLNPIEPFKVFR